MNHVSALDSFSLPMAFFKKNAGLFQPKFGSNVDKPKCWVETALKKITVESES